MNKEVLKNIDFINTVKVEITKVMALSNELNPALLWELVKAQIRSLSIIFSKSMSRHKAGKKKQLEHELSALEREICDGPYSQKVEDQVIKTKQQLEIETGKTLTLAEYQDLKSASTSLLRTYGFTCDNIPSTQIGPNHMGL